ncbi:hypothetical protein RHMOL_Rhmol06G0316800 [Rhododendron molle]|uniref:Uncharacterized protein n=1 Tax=Rhododendron molle TaxID=49168 RepID=A0ACC0NKQ6_RHOML|nr:hypothetical protein RHMOL_Rhmol06G0316800 [Rhododendron molle]
MCCAGKVCMLCTCVILVVIAIGILFGFGVFKSGFHKVKDTLHYSDPIGINNATFSSSHGRPFLGFTASPPL